MTQVTPTVLGGSVFTAPGYTTQSVHAPLRGAAFLLKRRGALFFRELMATLNGAAAGSAASATNVRIAAEADPNNYGGVETIETETLVSRNTTAADIARIAAEVLSRNMHNTSFPLNGDGNPRGLPGGN